MRYLHLSKPTRVYMYVWSHARTEMLMLSMCARMCAHSALAALCLSSVTSLLFTLSGWSRPVPAPPPPRPRPLKEEFIRHFWLRRPATVFTLGSLLNCVLLLEIFLQSSFTSQFSYQQSISPVPLYFARLLMPQSSLQSRTDGFWNKHSLTGELPHDPFRPGSCYDGARHHSPDRRRCACTTRHRITIRLIKRKMILAMSVRHRLPKRTKSKGKYMVKNTSFFYGWVILHRICALHFLYPSLCQRAFTLLSRPTIGNGAAKHTGKKLGDMD